MSEAHHGPPAGEVPNEEEAAEAFPHVASTRPLREQVDLRDETGEDIRQYTGEPVETDEGVVVPQQMVVGSRRVVGGGEYPNDEGAPRLAGHERGADPEARGAGEDG